jgi:CTD small phosphatase-like protein 2
VWYACNTCVCLILLSLAFAYQLSNGIPIESWYDNPADRELINVLQFLETLVGKEDVRPTVEKRFRMHELIKQAQMRQFSSSSSSSLSPLS